MVVLLSIYYLTPWLRWDRGPQSPNQAILIDLTHTRAYVFGLEIWPQEIYYITAILILAAIGLFFVTSLFGRIWCGYACPQTVWTDLFVWVERIVYGDRNARKKLDESPWTLQKLWKKTLTHFLWIIIALCTAGAWVFYFNDAPTLMDQLFHFDIPWSVGGWIVGLTASTYLMAGFAREQVCTYMCPYARFQSAMFDKDTLIIAYDEKRGEQRGHHKTGDPWEGRGHCIDCHSCVVVCPMGIDIRDGLQMDCIACGLCIDACDHVMTKVGLPKGLIRYDTEQAKQDGVKPKLRLLRPRTVLYTTVIIIVGALIIYGLLTRKPMELNVLHDRNPLFVTLSNGDKRNGYTISILNKTHEDQIYTLALSNMSDAQIHIQGSHEIQADQLMILADSVGHFRIFITAKAQSEARKKIAFILTDPVHHITDSKNTVFISEGK